MNSKKVPPFNKTSQDFTRSGNQRVKNRQENHNHPPSLGGREGELLGPCVNICLQKKMREIKCVLVEIKQWNKSKKKTFNNKKSVWLHTGNCPSLSHPNDATDGE